VKLPGINITAGRPSAQFRARHPPRKPQICLDIVFRLVISQCPSSWSQLPLLYPSCGMLHSTLRANLVRVAAVWVSMLVSRACLCNLTYSESTEQELNITRVRLLHGGAERTLFGSCSLMKASRAEQNNTTTYSIMRLGECTLRGRKGICSPSISCLAEPFPTFNCPAIQRNKLNTRG
jgi:hypothetical protein